MRRKTPHPLSDRELTAIARDVWRGCWGDEMPRGWRVQWAGFMRGAVGLCIYSERRILLSLGDFRRDRADFDFREGRIADGSGVYSQPPDILCVLIHEMVHARGYRRHGREFDAACMRAWTRVFDA